MNPPTSAATDKASSHHATVPSPNGKRAIIIIGDVKGIILHHTASGPVGLAIALVLAIMENMIGMVIGNIIA